MTDEDAAYLAWCAQQDERRYAEWANEQQRVGGQESPAEPAETFAPLTSQYNHPTAMCFNCCRDIQTHDVATLACRPRADAQRVGGQESPASEPCSNCGVLPNDHGVKCGGNDEHSGQESPAEVCIVCGREIELDRDYSILPDGRRYHFVCSHRVPSVGGQESPAEVCKHEQIDDGGECLSCGWVLPIEELERRAEPDQPTMVCPLCELAADVGVTVHGGCPHDKETP